MHVARDRKIDRDDLADLGGIDVDVDLRGPAAKFVRIAGRAVVETRTEGNQQVGFFVLDVSGHGVPAALLSVTAARHLWPYAGHDVVIPEDASAPFARGLDTRVAELNGTIAMEATAGHFLTLLYGVLDLRNRVFRFVCAGHPFPLLSRGDELREIGVPGLPKGRILGATIVAARAGDLIGQVSQAMTNGLRLGQIATTIQPYPTQAEAIRKVGDVFIRSRLTPRVRSTMRLFLRLRR